MSRYSGSQHKGARREAKEQRRREAEERQKAHDNEKKVTKTADSQHHRHARGH